jgi:homospermidine synthase
MTQDPIFAKITGPVVMIGFGSIGRGMLPLLERHFNFDRDRCVVLDPGDENMDLVESHGFRYLKTGLSAENYRDTLTPLLTKGGGTGFCINVSVDVSSLDVMRLCRDLGALYIDTCNEPWPGFYDNPDLDPGQRTNYALREALREEKRRHPGGPTAISCCGANPGMVSWFVKQALLNIAEDTGFKTAVPETRGEWAKLMNDLGVKGIHIAERDTQRSGKRKPIRTFVNTWSVDGMLSEGFQPAELGWGTHEKWMPDNARTHDYGCQAAIYLLQPGGNTRVRSWCPIYGAQFGFLITHNESISIADYFTIGEGATPQYRPTCHYAYHPGNDTVLSLEEIFGAGGTVEPEPHILDENEIVEGVDQLGVLLFGHAKNAYWFGSTLGIKETRKLVPLQNATALQVTSAILAGMVWALENPQAGIVETDEMDFRRCLEIQKPYLGDLSGEYTGWRPSEGIDGLFSENFDREDPWQFRNVLVR